MTEQEDEKDRAFDAIKESLGPEFSDPNLEQQEAIDELDARYGFNPKAKANTDDDKEGKERETKAQLVLRSARANYNKLFVDEYQVPHAAISIGGHLEVIPLGSKRFRNWIAGTVYRESCTVVDSNTIKDIIGVISAECYH